MKALCLISPGIDSPVAAYLMKKKGYDVEGIHFEMNAWNPSEMEKVLGIKINIIPFIPYQEKIKALNTPYHCILCKRTMLRLAEKYAKENNFKFLISGDNLGQVASQTLSNMKTIDSATEMRILRPLLCLEKNEITKIAKEIGTYEISIKENSSCAYVPKSPKTKSKIEYIERLESALTLD